jgi:hypothetical protein
MVVFQTRGEWITPLAKRNTPVSNSTAGVTLQRCLESLDGAAELERVQKRYSPIKFLLRIPIAGGGKVHRAQCFTVAMIVLLSKAGASIKEHEENYTETEKDPRPKHVQ